MKQKATLSNPEFRLWFKHLAINQEKSEQLRREGRYFDLVASTLLDERLALNKEGLEKFGVNSIEVYGW